MKAISNYRIVIFLIMVCGMCLSANLNAQQTKSPEDRAKAITDEMKSKLNLNDDQFKKVSDVNLKYAKERNDIFSGSGDKKSKEDKMKTSFDSEKNDMKSILTSDQYKKYEDMLKEMKKEAKKHKMK